MNKEQIAKTAHEVNRGYDKKRQMDGLMGQ